MASSAKIKEVLVASEWSSRKSGLSSLNRELAIQLAKHAKVDVFFFSSSQMRPDRKERSKEQQRHPSSGRTHTWL